LDRALQLDPTDAFALRRRGEVKRMAKDFVSQPQFLLEWLEIPTTIELLQRT